MPSNALFTKMASISSIAARIPHPLALLIVPVLGFSASTAYAEKVLVAVASNFTAPMNDIAHSFEAATGHDVTLSFGSSGKLFAQIRNGAPYHLFLSADQEKPLKLAQAGFSVPDTQFTYALGRLALWSAETDIQPLKKLKAGDFTRLALANPRLAPYGEAAIRTLSSLDLEQTTRRKRVTGENINQTWQFVSTGNAQLGFVALSQVTSDGHVTSGSAWIIPPERHQTIRQDAILLPKGTDNAAARALLDYLQSDETANIIRRYGYDKP